jgi:hypothetical protein
MTEAEKHNAVVAKVVEELVHEFSDKATRLVALESIVLGVLASVAPTKPFFTYYLPLLAAGVLERASELKAYKAEENND